MSQTANHISQFPLTQDTKLLTLLQLMDSGFPTGGFSHSQGLEAWIQHKGSKSLVAALACVMENAGSFGIPFVKEAHASFEQGNKLVELDQLCHACMTNHVAAKAGTRQGSSMLESAISVFKETSLSSTAVSVLHSLPHCHMEVVHGALMAALGYDLDTTLTSFMFGTLRTAMSAAVRLDVLGAIESQKVEHRLATFIPDIVKRNLNRSSSNATLKFPVVDVLQNTQDTFFCKLFYS